MKKNLLKSLFVAIAMVMGTGSASALTTNLSIDTDFPGYINSAFYDLATNDDGIMPTEGDLRFREGWGLFDFGSGNRSCDITFPNALAENDILVIDFYDTQGKGVTVNSISNCERITPLDASHLFFKATASGSTFNVNIGRAGCIAGILVIKEDPDASLVNYTVNYVCGNMALKQENLTGVVGGVPFVDKNPIYIEGGGKYIYESDNTEGATISSGSDFYVFFREAGVFTLTVNDDNFELIGTAQAYEGDNASVPFRRYQNRNGVLYQKAAYNNVYKFSAALTEDRTETIYYDATDKNNVVILLEGEDIAGLTPANGGTIDARASNAFGGYNPNEEDVVLCIVSPGTYTITVHTVGNTDSSENWIKAGGENVLNAKFEGNFGVFTGDFTVSQECNLTIGKFGSSQKVIDLLYLQSTNGNVTTAIKGVKSMETADDAIFNLAGQEVKSATKGIFIQNGKKVVK
jgi:hypothetical protein